MVRGLLSGMVVGGVSAAAVLVTISLVLPLPEPAPGAQAAAVPSPEQRDDGADAGSASDRQETGAAEIATPAEPPAEPLPETAGAVTEDSPREPPDLPEAAIVEVPAGSDFGRGRDDTQPVAPQRTEAAPDLAEAPAVSAPAAEPAPDLPEVETAAAPAVPPGPDAPGSPAAETAPPAAPAADSPVQAPAALPAPAAPEAPTAPATAATEPAAAPRSEPQDLPPPMVVATLPAAEPAPPMPDAAPGGAGIAIRPAEGIAPAGVRPGGLPQIDPEAGTAAEVALGIADPGARPEVGTLAPAMPVVEAAPEPGFGQAEGVRVNRLPQLGAEAGDEAPAAASDRYDGALGRFAADFDPPANSDLLGLVLIDPPAEADLMEPAELAAFGLPGAVAVDPLAPGAAERAAALRAAGFELGILAASVPGGAMPADLAVNFTAWTEALPEAALIVEAPDTRFQNIRSLAQLVVGLAGDAGFGLVTHDIGLNTADQLAGAAGLPRAESFDILDTATQTEAAIRRTLDRAAFEAERSGRVLVAAAARPETLAAITTWLVESRRTRLVPAPASAVLSAPAP